MSGGRLRFGADVLEARATAQGGRISVETKDAPTRSFEVERAPGGAWLLRDGDVTESVLVVRRGERWWVHARGRTWVLDAARAGASGVVHDSGSLEAPMTGRVASVACQAGDVVVRGQPLLVLAAMKMRIEIKAPFDGRVSQLHVAAGDQVEGGTTLAVVSPAEARA